MRLLICVISCFFCFAAAAQRPNLDSYKTPTDKLEAWSNYCDVVLDKEDWPKLRALAREGLDMGVPVNDYYRSLFNFYIGISFNYGTEADSAVYYLDLSEAQGRKAGNTKRITEALKQLLLACNSYGKSPRLRQALDSLQHIADTSRSIKGRGGILQALANYYSSQGQYERALQYQLEGITSRKEELHKGNHNDSINLGVLIQNVAELYLSMGQPDKAIEYTRESSHLMLNYKEGIYHVNKDFVDAYLMKPNLDSAVAYYNKLSGIVQQYNDGWENLAAVDLSFGEYYLSKKDNAKALSYVVHANALATSKGLDPFTISQVNYMSGKTYLALKDYTKALQFLLKAEPVAKEGPSDIYSSLQRSLAETYAATGLWQQAYDHFMIHNTLQDSLLGEAAKHNLAEMEAKYQNKEKQQKIDGLSAENTIKTLQVKDAEKQRLFLVIGLLLLLVIIASMVIIYRNKQRSSRLLQQKNEEMNVLNANLEEANNTKAKLFSIISHDLRSPISQVYQFLDLQKNDPSIFSEEDKAKHNEEISKAAGMVLETMEDLLIWSKTQMQQFTLSPEKINVPALVQGIAEFLTPQAAKKQITIAQEVPAITVNTDKNILTIILRNLLQNAITYSPQQSRITIAAKESAGNIIFSIADEGAGMPESIKRLFSTAATNVNSNHSGLGLTIVKEMVTLIKATIEIVPNHPSGTTINILLPQQALPLSI